MTENKGARVNSGSKSESSQPGGTVFIAAALDMTWRLAAVVLVPIIGGHFLDEAFNTSPWITVAGFIIAFLGVIAVMRYVVADSNRRVAGFSAGKKGRG